MESRRQRQDSPLHMEADSSDAPPQIILASTSPRRRTLLAWLGAPFVVTGGDVDETVAKGATPEAAVLELAERKARAALDQGKTGVIVGDDRVVALDGDILGEPADDAAALTMLRRLGGRAHEVWTGLAVIDVGSGRTARPPAATS
jgi:nucleoside triphosphate pyrophosphatase